MSTVSGKPCNTLTSPVLMAVFIRLSGVAPVTASVYAICCPATGHDVIAAGKLTRRKQRPTMAGLKGLQPSPPKVILPMPMATSAPTIIIQMGKLLGRFMPSSRPVMQADPSSSVVGRRSI